MASGSCLVARFPRPFPGFLPHRGGLVACCALVLGGSVLAWQHPRQATRLRPRCPEILYPGAVREFGGFGGSVVHGDVDGDGDVDLVLATQSGMALLRNLGGGRLGPPEIDDPFSPSGVGDMDGNGDLDLVGGTSGPALRFGNGDGTFGAPVLLPGIHLAYLDGTPGDLDGDLDLDLVYLDPSSNKVLVYLNQGGGIFAAPTLYNGPTDVVDLALGDLDGDLDLDLAVVGWEMNPSVFLYLNQGDGSFVSGGGLTIPYALDIECEDLDADGDRDLLLADTYGGAILFLNNGNATFAGPVSFPAGSGALSLAVADLDGDGDPDFALSETAGAGGVAIFENLGAGSFAGPTWAGTLWAANRIELPDLDGDGRGDLVAVQYQETRLSVNGNRGNGTFEGSEVLLAGFGPTPNALVFGDMDGDGDPDGCVARVAFAGDGTVVPLENRPSGRLVAGASQAVGANPGDLALADLDGDGARDLVVGTDTGVSVLLNPGDGTLGPAVEHALAWRANAVALGDLDGDGVRDLAVAHDAPSVSILFNPGDGSFLAPASHVAETGLDLVLSDLDRDGDLDLALTNSSGDAAVLLLNTGAGGLGVPSLLAAGDAPVAIASADLDQDGLPELLLADWYGNDLALLANLGAGAFGPPVLLGVGHDPSAVAARDLDGDGDLELIVRNQGDATVSVFEGSLPWSYGTPGLYGIYDRSARMDFGRPGVAIADLEGDGRLDLVSSGFGVTVLRSLCR